VIVRRRPLLYLETSVFGFCFDPESLRVRLLSPLDDLRILPADDEEVVRYEEWTSGLA
jgi:hypothetical protein